MRFLTTFLPLLLLSATLAAQTPVKAPDAPPVPVQTAVPIDPPLDPKLPTLFIVGDSTARNGANLGWGDHFAPLFDTAKINIANRSRAGRSSRSYTNEGLWDHVLSEMKPGDFVLFQMGHNDGGSSADRIASDAKGRASIKGLGEESVDIPIAKPFTNGPLTGKTTETVHTYGHNMRKYFAEARAKGATPILLTPTVRNIWKDGQIERDMGFRDFDFQLGIDQHLPVADMASIAADKFELLGPEKTAVLFPIDHTHTSPEGADMNAHSVATALRTINSPLVAYLNYK